MRILTYRSRLLAVPPKVKNPPCLRLRIHSSTGTNGRSTFEGKDCVFLWHIFAVKPVAAVSLLICLATIVSCLYMRRKRPHETSDRFLLVFLGAVSIYQGMRILKGVGVVTVPVNASVDDAIELLVTMAYLVAALLLKLST